MDNNSPFFTQSRNFNTNTSHPLIPSSQEYIYYKKYVSIHSEDRNTLKYPRSSEFEIELPEDILNVAALRLVSWTFPANYNTFSVLNDNVAMTFLRPADETVSNINLKFLSAGTCQYLPIKN